MFTRSLFVSSRYFLIFLAGLAALAPLSIDTYLPAIPTMATYFNVNIASVNLTMTSYLIGTGIGNLLGGALSDHLGRKPIGLFGLSLYIFSSFTIVYSPTIEWVQLFRALQAIGGGFAAVVCMAQVRDVYPPLEVSKKIALMMMVSLLAPLLAPLIGALLLQLGWKSVFITLGIYSTLYFTLYCFLIPETNKQPRKRITFHSMFSGYISVISHRTNGKITAIRYALFAGFNAGVFMSFLTNAAFIYMHYFKLTPYQFSAAFACNALMLMTGNRIASRLMNTTPETVLLKKFNNLQLILLLTTLICLSVGLTHFWLIFLLLQLSMIINGAVTPTAAGIFISYFDKNAGSAASLNASMVFIFGSLTGALATLLTNDKLTPIFLVMLAAACLSRLTLFKIDQSTTNQ
jgi:DHA1 family bicyclomycin/chloramphenicol resistance-like MFS transporter